LQDECAFAEFTAAASRFGDAFAFAIMARDTTDGGNNGSR
jgi:hypothetical protein